MHEMDSCSHARRAHAREMGMCTRDRHVHEKQARKGRTAAMCMRGEHMHVM